MNTKQKVPAKDPNRIDRSKLATLRDKIPADALNSIFKNLGTNPMSRRRGIDAAPKGTAHNSANPHPWTAPTNT